MKTKTLGLVVFGLAAVPLMVGPVHARGERGGGDAWFEAVDVDSDGKVTVAEIEAHRLARFNAADSNGDGKLSVEELTAGREARSENRRERGLARMIERLDTDGDGSLSVQELAARDRTGRAMERLDTNGDGAIAREEMAAHRKGGERHRGKDGRDRETR